MKLLITFTALLGFALAQNVKSNDAEVKFIKPVSSDQKSKISTYEFALTGGEFYNKYETDNGLYGLVFGEQREFGGNPPVAPVVFEGEYSYTSPEGKQISIKYVADENGFIPTGDSIPTAPPVPEAIRRALEYVAKLKKQQ